jgi:hypothetical protein
VAPGWVTLSGTPIEREAWRMIEIVPGSVQRAVPPAPPPALTPRVARARTLRGEIVDSKCFLGVMNPGERTVHRDCATRCLSGGVPAMFAYHDETGSHLALLLGATPEIRTRGTAQVIVLTGVLSGPEEAQVFAIDDTR